MMQLEIKDGVKFYVSGREITKALQGINVCFQTGEFVAITGESGSGKSTLAHILAGVFPCDKGTLYVNGENSTRYGEEEWEAYRREKISLISQNYGILPGNTVWDNVICALTLAGLTKKQAKERTEKLLRHVDLWKLRHRRAAKLSSGQKQRLSIARAVAKPSPVLVADEPTSNLDAENTEKIVQLFAEESKSRLVLIVTHDFEAVADKVTRRIEVKNGSIVADTVMHENGLQQSENTEEESHQRFPLGNYIAGLQLKARPVWTLMVTGFFLLTAFAVFAFLGTFFSALQDDATRYYDEAAFPNGDEKRLAVLTVDGRGFTEEEYKMLASLEYVEGVERYGIVSDINYYYRPDVDFVTRYVQGAEGYEEQIVLRGQRLYIKTIPMLVGEEEFLTAGRLPEHFHEVVAAGSEKLIGTTITVYFRNRKTWGEDTYLKEEMTVVGVTEQGTDLYFSDRVGLLFWQLSEAGENIGSYVYGIDRNMTENQFSIPAKAAPLVLREVRREGTLVLKNLKDGSVADVSYGGTALQNHPYFVGFSEQLFDELSLEGTCNQVSVYLQDYSYAGRVMEKIRESGYEVLSPYQLGTITQNEQLKQERMTTLVLCLTAMILVLLVQTIVLAAMFTTEMKGYKQLRLLGLRWKDGKASVYRQIIMLTVVGQLLCAGLIWLCFIRGVEEIVQLTKYTQWWHFPIYVLVSIGASLLGALVVSRNLRKRVFPFLPDIRDVELSELDAGKEREE